MPETTKVTLAWLPAGAEDCPEGSATVTAWMLAGPTLAGATLLLKLIITGMFSPGILPPMGPEVTLNGPEPDGLGLPPLLHPVTIVVSSARPPSKRRLELRVMRS